MLIFPFILAKLQDASFEHIPCASRPSSPDTQLALTESGGHGVELTPEESEVYMNYINQELSQENIEIMSKELLDKIK